MSTGDTGLFFLFITRICFLIHLTYAYTNEEFTYYFELHRFKLAKDQDHYHVSLNENITINLYKQSNESFANITGNATLSEDDLARLTAIPPMIIHIEYNNIFKNNTLKSIKNDHILINYDNDMEWNEVKITENVFRNTRRRMHSWWHHWWGHRWFPTEIQHWGRFIAMKPGGWGWLGHGPNQYLYNDCSWWCRVHYGEMASIDNWWENSHASSACWHVAVRGAHRGAGHTHSCWIGLRRPFHKWDDGRNVRFTKWQPGEPNNWRRWTCSWWHCRHVGPGEDCTEMYMHGWAHSRWNDGNCHHTRRACLCEQPRGLMKGRFIGVVATRNWWGARHYCQHVYGTDLASIFTQSENDDVLHLCKQVQGNTPHGIGCYIGLKRPFSKWADQARAARYSNWLPGEPNNHNEQCAELLVKDRYGYGQSRFRDGGWNDIACHAHRGFVCNAQTKLQRMDKGTRDMLIARRMHRHKFKWEMYKEMARRKKISAELWDKLQKQKAEYMQQRLAEHERMRDALREEMFTRQFGGYLQNLHVKRRRRLIQKRLKNKQKRKKMKKNKKKLIKNDDEINKKIEQRRNDKKVIRNIEIEDRDLFDEVDLFYKELGAIKGDDDDDDDNIPSFDDVRDEVNVILPLKCTLLNNDNREVYEICINHRFIEIKKYIQKKGKNIKMELSKKMDFNDILLVDEMNHREFNDDNNNKNQFSFIDFEHFKYHHSSKVKDLAKKNDLFIRTGIIKENIDLNTHYTTIHDKLYDKNNNHHRQCWSDIYNDNHFEVCLEYIEYNNDILMDVTNSQCSYTLDEYLFSNDNVWDEINEIFLNEEKDAIEKCKNFFIAKLCIVQDVNTNIFLKIYKESIEDDISFG